jgi:hypothetical protein
MAFVPPKDRVLEYSISNSQTVFTVTGAPESSMNPFSASMSVGDTTIGGVVEPGVAFVSGILTYSAANQVTVTTATESKGTFSASGLKHVFMGQPAALTPSGAAEPTAVTGASATIAAATQAVAITRAAPSATALTLPSVASRGGVPLKIIDWSTSVTDHTITLTPNGSETIMKAATWPLYSNAASLASVTLYPSTTLNGWYIAP